MQETIQVEAKITEVLPNTLYRAEIERSDDLPELVGRILLCHMSGKMRMRRWVKLMTGDRVKIEMNPKYDLDKGRIVFKSK